MAARATLFLLSAALLLLLQLSQAFMVPRVPASPVAARSKAPATLKQQQAFAPVPTALLAAGDEDPETATEEAGPLGVVAAGLGLVACPVVRELDWAWLDGSEINWIGFGWVGLSEINGWIRPDWFKTCGAHARS